MKTNRKSISFVIPSLSFGGAENQLVCLARGLRNRGWDIQVIHMIDITGYVEELRSIGCEVVSLGMKRGKADIRGLFRIVRFLKQWKPLVLHSHMIHANLLSRIARLFVHVPVCISTAHSVNEGRAIRQWGYRLTHPLTDLHTTICKAGLDVIEAKRLAPSRKVKYVPNGLEIKKFRSDPAVRLETRQELNLTDEFVWLIVARFEPVKGYKYLLEAFSKLKNNKNILLIVGKGPIRSEMAELAYMNELIQKYQLTDRVRLLGVRHDIPRLLNAADAFVLPSLWEGLSIALLEASSVGVPIVCTNVGGNAEIVLDGKSGMLVPAGDSESLSVAMQEMMNLTPLKREEMGKVASHHIDSNYSIDRIVDIWETIYRDLLQKKGISGVV